MLKNYLIPQDGCQAITRMIFLRNPLRTIFVSLELNTPIPLSI